MADTIGSAPGVPDNNNMMNGGLTASHAVTNVTPDPVAYGLYAGHSVAPVKPQAPEYDPEVNMHGIIEQITLSNGRKANQRSIDKAVYLNQGNTDDTSFADEKKKGWYAKDANGNPYRLPDNQQGYDLNAKYGRAPEVYTDSSGKKSLRLGKGKSALYHLNADEAPHGVEGFYDENDNLHTGEGFWRATDRVAGHATKWVARLGKSMWDQAFLPKTNPDALSSLEAGDTSVIAGPGGSERAVKEIQENKLGPAGGDYRKTTAGQVVGGIYNAAAGPVRFAQTIQGEQGEDPLGRIQAGDTSASLDEIKKANAKDQEDPYGIGFSEEDRLAKKIQDHAFTNGTLPKAYGSEEANKWAKAQARQHIATKELEKESGDLSHWLEYYGVGDLDTFRSEQESVKQMLASYSKDDLKNGRIKPEDVAQFNAYMDKVKKLEFADIKKSLQRVESLTGELHTLAKKDSIDEDVQALREFHNSPIFEMSEFLTDLAITLPTMSLGGKAALKLAGASRFAKLTEAVKAFEAASAKPSLLKGVTSGGFAKGAGIQTIHTAGMLAPGFVSDATKRLYNDETVGHALGGAAVDTLKSFPAFFAMNSRNLRSLTTIFKPSEGWAANTAIRTTMLASLNTLSDAIIGGKGDEATTQFWHHMANLAMFEIHGGYKGSKNAKELNKSADALDLYGKQADREAQLFLDNNSSNKAQLKRYQDTINAIREDHPAIAKYIRMMSAGEEVPDNVAKEAFDQLGKYLAEVNQAKGGSPLEGEAATAEKNTTMRNLQRYAEIWNENASTTVTDDMGNAVKVEPEANRIQKGLVERATKIKEQAKLVRGLAEEADNSVLGRREKARGEAAPASSKDSGSPSPSKRGLRFKKTLEATARNLNFDEDRIEQHVQEETERRVQEEGTSGPLTDIEKTSIDRDISNLKANGDPSFNSEEATRLESELKRVQTAYGLVEGKDLSDLDPKKRGRVERANQRTVQQIKELQDRIAELRKPSAETAESIDIIAKRYKISNEDAAGLLDGSKNLEDIKKHIDVDDIEGRRKYHREQVDNEVFDSLMQVHKKATGQAKEKLRLILEKAKRDAKGRGQKLRQDAEKLRKTRKERQKEKEDKKVASPAPEAGSGEAPLQGEKAPEASEATPPKEGSAKPTFKFNLGTDPTTRKAQQYDFAMSQLPQGRDFNAIHSLSAKSPDEAYEKAMLWARRIVPHFDPDNVPTDHGYPKVEAKPEAKPEAPSRPTVATPATVPSTSRVDAPVLHHELTQAGNATDHESIIKGEQYVPMNVDGESGFQYKVSFHHPADEAPKKTIGEGKTKEEAKAQAMAKIKKYSAQRDVDLHNQTKKQESVGETANVITTVKADGVTVHRTSFPNAVGNVKLPDGSKAKVLRITSRGEMSRLLREFGLPARTGIKELAVAAKKAGYDAVHVTDGTQKMGDAVLAYPSQNKKTTPYIAPSSPKPVPVLSTERAERVPFVESRALFDEDGNRLPKYEPPAYEPPKEVLDPTGIEQQLLDMGISQEAIDKRKEGIGLIKTAVGIVQGKDPIGKDLPGKKVSILRATLKEIRQKAEANSQRIKEANRRKAKEAEFAEENKLTQDGRQLMFGREYAYPEDYPTTSEDSPVKPGGIASTVRPRSATKTVRGVSKLEYTDPREALIDLAYRSNGTVYERNPNREITESNPLDQFGAASVRAYNQTRNILSDLLEQANVDPYALADAERVPTTGSMMVNGRKVHRTMHDSHKARLHNLLTLAQKALENPNVSKELKGDIRTAATDITDYFTALETRARNLEGHLDDVLKDENFTGDASEKKAQRLAAIKPLEEMLGKLHRSHKEQIMAAQRWADGNKMTKKTQQRVESAAKELGIDLSKSVSDQDRTKIWSLIAKQNERGMDPGQKHFYSPGLLAQIKKALADPRSKLSGEQDFDPYTPGGSPKEMPHLLKAELLRLTLRKMGLEEFQHPEPVYVFNRETGFYDLEEGKSSPKSNNPLTVDVKWDEFLSSLSNEKQGAIKRLLDMPMTTEQLQDVLEGGGTEETVKREGSKPSFPVGWTRKLLKEVDFGDIEFQQDSSAGYLGRTEKNAQADLTLAFAHDFKTGGEKKTAEFVKKAGKTLLEIDTKKGFDEEKTIADAVAALNNASGDSVSINVAGNGIYTLVKEPGGESHQQAVMDQIVHRVLHGIVNSPDLTKRVELIRSGGQTGADEAGIKAARRLGIKGLVLAPKGWKMKDSFGKTHTNEETFKRRFDPAFDTDERSEWHRANPEVRSDSEVRIKEDGDPFATEINEKGNKIVGPGDPHPLGNLRWSEIERGNGALDPHIRANRVPTFNDGRIDENARPPKDILKELLSDEPMPSSYLRAFGKQFVSEKGLTGMNQVTSEYARMMDDPILLAKALGGANARYADALEAYEKAKTPEDAETAHEALRKMFAKDIATDPTRKHTGLAKLLGAFLETEAGQKARLESLSEDNNASGIHTDWDVIRRGQGTSDHPFVTLHHPVPSEKNIFDLQSHIHNKVQGVEFAKILSGDSGVNSRSVGVDVAPEVSYNIKARPIKRADGQISDWTPEVEMLGWGMHGSAERWQIERNRKRSQWFDWENKLRTAKTTNTGDSIEFTEQDWKAGDKKILSYSGDPARHQSNKPQSEKVRSNWLTKLDTNLRRIIADDYMDRYFTTRKSIDTNDPDYRAKLKAAETKDRADAVALVDKRIAESGAVTFKEMNDVALSLYHEQENRPEVRVSKTQSILKRVRPVSDLKKFIPELTDRLKLRIVGEAGEDSLLGRFVKEGIINSDTDGVTTSRIADETTVENKEGLKQKRNNGLILLDAFKTINAFENYDYIPEGMLRKVEDGFNDTKYVDEFNKPVGVSSSAITDEQARMMWADEQANARLLAELSGNPKGYKEYKQALERVVQTMYDYGILKDSDFYGDWSELTKTATKAHSDVQDILSNDNSAISREALRNYAEVRENLKKDYTYRDRFDDRALTTVLDKNGGEVPDNAEIDGDRIRLYKGRETKMQAARDMNLTADAIKSILAMDLPWDLRSKLTTVLDSVTSEGLDMLHQTLKDKNLSYYDHDIASKLHTRLDAGGEYKGRDQLAALISKTHPDHYFTVDKWKDRRGLLGNEENPEDLTAGESVEQQVHRQQIEKESSLDKSNGLSGPRNFRENFSRFLDSQGVKTGQKQHLSQLREVKKRTQELARDLNLQAMRNSEEYRDNVLDYLERTGQHALRFKYFDNLQHVSTQLRGFLNDSQGSVDAQYGDQIMRFIKVLDPLMVAHLKFEVGGDGALGSYPFGSDTVRMNGAWLNMTKPRFMSGENPHLKGTGERANATRYLAHEIGHWLTDYIDPRYMKEVNDRFWSSRTEYGKQNPWFGFLYGGGDSLFGDAVSKEGFDKPMVRGEYDSYRISDAVRQNAGLFGKDFVIGEYVTPDARKFATIHIKNGKDLVDVLTVTPDGEYQLHAVDYKSSYRYMNVDEYFAEGMRQAIMAGARKALPGIAGDIEGLRLDKKGNLPIVFSANEEQNLAMIGMTVNTMSAMQDAHAVEGRDSLAVFAEIFHGAGTGETFSSSSAYRYATRWQGGGTLERTKTSLRTKLQAMERTEFMEREPQWANVVEEIGREERLAASKRSSTIKFQEKIYDARLADKLAKVVTKPEFVSKSVREGTRFLTEMLAADARTSTTRELANGLNITMSEFKADQALSQMLGKDSWKMMDKILKPTITTKQIKEVKATFDKGMEGQKKVVAVDDHMTAVYTWDSWDTLLANNHGNEQAALSSMDTQLRDFGMITVKENGSFYRAQRVTMDNGEVYWGSPDKYGRMSKVVSDRTIDALSYLQTYGRPEDKGGRQGGKYLKDSEKKILDNFMEKAQVLQDSRWTSLTNIPDVNLGAIEGLKRDNAFPNMHEPVWRGHEYQEVNDIDPIRQMTDVSYTNTDRIKKRIHETAYDAVMKDGLLPKYHNPIDAWLQGGRQFRRMTVLRQFLSDIAGYGLGSYTHPSELTPTERKAMGGFADSDFFRVRLGDKGVDREALTDPKSVQKGDNIFKDFYVHKEIYPVLDAVFGSGLNDAALWRNAMRLNHILSPLTLGFSGFHVANTVGILGAQEAVRNGGIVHYQQLRAEGVGRGEAVLRGIAGSAMQFLDSIRNQRGNEFIDTFAQYGHLDNHAIAKVEGLNPMQKAILLMAKVGHYDPKLNLRYETMHRDVLSRLWTELGEKNPAAMAGIAPQAYMALNEMFQTQVMRKVNNAKASHLMNAYAMFLEDQKKSKGWTDENLVENVLHDITSGDLRQNVSVRDTIKGNRNFTQESNLGWNRVDTKMGYKTGEVAETARRLAGHTDNIFGMVNYDALFMNPKLKHLLLAKDLAFGWKQGNFSLFFKAMDQGANRLDEMTGDFFGYRAAKNRFGGTGLKDTLDRQMKNADGTVKLDSKGNPVMQTKTIGGFTGMSYLASAAIIGQLYNLVLRHLPFGLGAQPVKDWDERDGTWSSKTLQLIEDTMFPAMGNAMNHNGEYQRYSFGYNKEIAEMMMHPTKAMQYLFVGGLSPTSQMIEDFTRGTTAVGQPLGDPRFLGIFGKKGNDVRQGYNELQEKIVDIPGYGEANPFALPLSILAEMGNRIIPISLSSWKTNTEQGMDPYKAAAVSQTGFRTMPMDMGAGKSSLARNLDREARKGFTGTERTWEMQMGSERLQSAVREYVNSFGENTDALEKLRDEGFSSKKIDNAISKFKDFDENFMTSDLDKAISRNIRRNKLAVIDMTLKYASPEQMKIVAEKWLRPDIEEHGDTYRGLENIAKNKLEILNQRLIKLGIDPLEIPEE